MTKSTNLQLLRDAYAAASAAVASVRLGGLRLRAEGARKARERSSGRSTANGVFNW